MSSNKSYKNINQDNFYNTSKDDVLIESQEILSNNEKVSTIDKKRKDTNGFSNPKRDVSALYLILRSIIFILVLIIGAYFFNQGIAIYKEKINLEFKKQQTLSPILKEVKLIDSVNFENLIDKNSFFEKQVSNWKLSERNLIAAKDLESRGNINEAIRLCHKSLNNNPANLDTLVFLIDLYERDKSYIEAINTIFRVLSVENDNPVLLEKLVSLLYQIEDFSSVIFVSEFYNENYIFNYNVNLLRANSFSNIKDFKNAITLYKRLAIIEPNDLNPINAQINIHFLQKNYSEALPLLNSNYEKFHRDEKFYYNYALCNAELGDINKVCEILSKANKIFGPFTVKDWLNNPVYSKFGENRIFKIFNKRIDKKIDELRNP
ncbi:MAG: CDC27 family protein [Verrucomicrobiota bacterium]|nr:CDC27 family protein [Verrucomicrobiota bacterium]